MFYLIMFTRNHENLNEDIQFTSENSSTEPNGPNQKSINDINCDANSILQESIRIKRIIELLIKLLLRNLILLYLMMKNQLLDNELGKKFPTFYIFVLIIQMVLII